jgi:hypothetical protein
MIARPNQKKLVSTVASLTISASWLTALKASAASATAAQRAITMSRDTPEFKMKLR